METSFRKFEKKIIKINVKKILETGNIVLTKAHIPKVVFKSHRTYMPSGIKDLDKYLGGGIAENTMMLIEEYDTYSTYSLEMLRQVLRESLTSNHSVIMAAEEQQLKDLFNQQDYPQSDSKVTTIKLTSTWPNLLRPTACLGLPAEMEQLLRNLTNTLKSCPTDVPLKMILVMPSECHRPSLSRFYWLLRSLVKSNPGVEAFVAQATHPLNPSSLHLLYDYCLVLKPFEVSAREEMSCDGLLDIARVVRLETDRPLPDSRALCFKSGSNQDFKIYHFNPGMTNDDSPETS